MHIYQAKKERQQGDREIQIMGQDEALI